MDKINAQVSWVEDLQRKQIITKTKVGTKIIAAASPLVKTLFIPISNASHITINVVEMVTDERTVESLK